MVENTKLQTSSTVLIIPENQISPLSISTPDGEKLYAWHILPLAVYAKNEQLLVGQVPERTEDYTATESFKLLANDPESRLVISCEWVIPSESHLGDNYGEH